MQIKTRTAKKTERWIITSVDGDMVIWEPHVIIVKISVVSLEINLNQLKETKYA